MRCWVSKPGDSTKFTVYTAKWCDACTRQVPEIQSLAQKHGFEVELVDVDDPEAKKMVQHVRFVPHIEYLGLEISFNTFLQMLGETEEDNGETRLHRKQ